MTELLYEFAKKNSIPESRVDKFLQEKNRVSTLSELEDLPYELLNHIDYISYCPEPLKSFIQDEMWCERYMTIELERVVDCINDRMEYNEEDEPLSVEESETNKELQKVIDCMVKNRFGSVTYDW